MDRPSPLISRTDSLPRDTERMLLELLSAELLGMRQTKKCRQDLEQRFDFSARAAFNAVDQLNQNRIDSLQLQKFISGQGYSATQREVYAIIRRIDCSGSGLLCL